MNQIGCEMEKGKQKYYVRNKHVGNTYINKDVCILQWNSCELVYLEMYDIISNK